MMLPLGRGRAGVPRPIALLHYTIEIEIDLTTCCTYAMLRIAPVIAAPAMQEAEWYSYAKQWMPMTRAEQQSYYVEQGIRGQSILRMTMVM